MKTRSFKRKVRKPKIVFVQLQKWSSLARKPLCIVSPGTCMHNQKMFFHTCIPRDLELWHMTLTSKLEPQRVRTTMPSTYFKRHVIWKLLSYVHTDWTECSTCSTKWLAKSECQSEMNSVTSQPLAEEEVTGGNLSASELLTVQYCWYLPRTFPYPPGSSAPGYLLA